MTSVLNVAEREMSFLAPVVVTSALLDEPADLEHHLVALLEHQVLEPV